MDIGITHDVYEGALEELLKAAVWDDPRAIPQRPAEATKEAVRLNSLPPAKLTATMALHRQSAAVQSAAGSTTTMSPLQPSSAVSAEQVSPQCRRSPTDEVAEQSGGRTAHWMTTAAVEPAAVRLNPPTRLVNPQAGAATEAERKAVRPPMPNGTAPSADLTAAVREQPEHIPQDQMGEAALDRPAEPAPAQKSAGEALSSSSQDQWHEPETTHREGVSSDQEHVPADAAQHSLSTGRPPVHSSATVDNDQDAASLDHDFTAQGIANLIPQEMANSVAHQKAANSVRRTTPAVHSCFAWMGQVVENSRHKLHTTFREKQKLRTRRLPSTTKAMESTPPLTASSSAGGSHSIAPQSKTAEDVAAEAPRSQPRHDEAQHQGADRRAEAPVTPEFPEAAAPATASTTLPDSLAITATPVSRISQSHWVTPFCLASIIRVVRSGGTQTEAETMTPLCCNAAEATSEERAADDRTVRETAKRALIRKARQNTGTDDEDENDLAPVPAGPAIPRAGNRVPSDDIERATPTRSSDASSDWQRLRRFGNDATARRPTEAREHVQALVKTVRLKPDTSWLRIACRSVDPASHLNTRLRQAPQNREFANSIDSFENECLNKSQDLSTPSCD